MNDAHHDNQNKTDLVRGKLLAAKDKVAAGFGRVRSAVARHPVSPLLYVTVLAVAIGAIAFAGNYTRAYVVNLDGEEVGMVSDKEELDVVLSNVETRVAGIMGEDYDYDPDITLTPTYTLAKTCDAAELEAQLFQESGVLKEAYAIAVNGDDVGYAATEAELQAVLDRVAQPYLTDDTVSYEFVGDVEILPVELPSDAELDVEALYAKLTQFDEEESRYVVQKGDTFGGIAKKQDMTMAELQALNPGVNVNRLSVGQQLVIKQAVPFLSVRTHTDETYEEAIPSPVEYIKTPNLYVGNTSVKEKGTDGVAKVNAQVTYVNGVEEERTIISSVTLQEPTTTYMYTGTTPKPATASKGYYIYPVRGTLTSGYGYRYIFGSREFHTGIDLAAGYGTTVKAADGGTVTFAGWKGSYGKLIIITHDNGQQTYYAHNGNLYVGVGDKVYQGQAISTIGLTGRTTGPHLHFEIRVNGKTVNPLSYL